MFEQNGLEAMMARLHSGSNVFFFGQVLFSSFVIVAPVTAGFAQCVCQDFTHCRFLMVFLCCQALAQDAGAHGRRASQALKFLIDHFLCCQSCSMFCPCFGRPLSWYCMSLAFLPDTGWMSRAMKRRCSHDRH